MKDRGADTGAHSGGDNGRALKAPHEGQGLTRFAPYMINRIARRYNQTLQDAVTGIGLTVPKMRVLAALAAMGKLTVNELTVVAVAEQSMQMHINLSGWIVSG